MKNIVITLFLFFICTSFICAQEIHENNENKEIQLMCGLGLTGGYGYMDVSKLQVFVPKNIGKFSSNHIIMGANGFAIRNKCIYGISGYGITGDLIKSDSINVSLKGGVGTFDFGYLILNKKNVKIFPMIGIGGSAYGLQIEKNKDVSVSKISDNPGQEIKITKGGFVADLSLNLNFTPSPSSNEKKNYGGIMTGIKLGYVYSLPSSDWKFSGGDITGGPNFGLNMFYAKLIIGGFGYSNKM
jgi:hypothetical protein